MHRQIFLLFESVMIVEHSGSSSLAGEKCTSVMICSTFAQCKVKNLIVEISLLSFKFHFCDLHKATVHLTVALAAARKNFARLGHANKFHNVKRLHERHHTARTICPCLKQKKNFLCVSVLLTLKL